jgi:hypothetical protein
LERSVGDVRDHSHIRFSDAFRKLHRDPKFDPNRKFDGNAKYHSDAKPYTNLEFDRESHSNLDDKPDSDPNAGADFDPNAKFKSYSAGAVQFD